MKIAIVLAFTKVFYARLDAHGSWSKPVNIGYPINSTEDEVGLFVSTDGTQGFFASNIYNGKGGWDLYSFDHEDGKLGIGHNHLSWT